MTNENLTPVLISGVSCYERAGTAYLRLEDVARGLGFVETHGGKEYVRWQTVEKYLRDIGFSQKVEKDGYIPENVFYRLSMKANNPVAEKFQALVADEIIPGIRKTGSYSIIQADPNLPPELALANQTLAAVNKIYQMQLSQGERLDKLEATKTLDYAQQLAIQDAKSQRVVNLLGGKKSAAYQDMSNRVFYAIGHDLKKLFGCGSYKDIPAIWCDYEGDQLQVVIDGVTYLVHSSNIVMRHLQNESNH